MPHKPSIIPIYSLENSQFFAPGVKPRISKVGDHEVLTAPFAFDKKFNLLDISSSEALLSDGTIDMTDSIALGSFISWLFFEIRKEGQQPKIITYRAVPSRGVFSMLLKSVEKIAYVDKEIEFTKRDVDDDGQNLYFLGEDKLKISVSISGTVKREIGDVFFATPNFTCNSLDCEVELIGYELQAQRQNLNRRPLIA